MASLVFITHPEVIVAPEIDVRQWRLSEAGVARMAAFSGDPVVADATSVWSSAEVKAVEAAEILAARLAIGRYIDADLGENDRSGTGYLPRDEFEATADAFFAEPERSVRGWERAIDAQRRIRRAADRIVAAHDSGDIAVVAHGAVGSLLLCSYLGIPISRAADQPFQGHYWRVELPVMQVLHRWKPIARTE